MKKIIKSVLCSIVLCSSLYACTTNTTANVSPEQKTVVLEQKPAVKETLPEIDNALVGKWIKNNLVIESQNNETYDAFKTRISTQFNDRGTAPDSIYCTDKNGYGEDFEIFKDAKAKLTNERDLYQYEMQIKVDSNKLIVVSQIDNILKFTPPNNEWVKSSEKNNLNEILAYVSKKQDIMIGFGNTELIDVSKLSGESINKKGYALSVYKKK